ncbi:MAG TPA: hypothetical protein VNU66_05770 [Mycobacteriales bacterium]|nr:hypothetical protein [Mycobacteriales bacterium]
MTTTATPPATSTGTGRAPGRLGGAAGIAFVVLALAGNSLTGGGVDSAAPSEAHAAEVVRRTADAAWRAGTALELVAFLALLVFSAALARRIRLSEPREGYLGLTVLAAGTLLAAVKLASGSALYAADRRAGELDGDLARLLTDLNDASFALSFVPLGLLLGAAAVAALAHGALPRALGWTGVPVAVLLVAAASTGADAVPVPFLLALVWLVATGVVLLRRPNAS